MKNKMELKSKTEIKLKKWWLDESIKLPLLQDDEPKLLERFVNDHKYTGIARLRYHEIRTYLPNK